MTIEIYPSRTFWGRREWRFRIVARNGEPLASSEGYRNKVDCRQTAVLIRDRIVTAEIEEVDQ